ncbi:type II toxin-antitoxin system VapB family antitoxin [Sphingomonas sp. 37zxx]|uniref:type II toxin-antitoxin system VapB family antitoxin n=1 Tax=Sphingomonas sp. 37zxx TaxID=1550073 RepID=UPI00053BEE7D|nr:type II toxin-antitoxin system VapB family antitoxin [Sphingomonas sp. 37zxx]
MASLYIKDGETAALAARVAARMGISKTEAVRSALQKVEAELGPEQVPQSTVEWLMNFRRDNPLPPPTGLKADKAFFDWLSGEEDVPDA